MSPLTTKPTKWPVHPTKTQISLGIRPVWSESSLSASWRNHVSLAVAKTLIRLGRCPGWSESSLGAQVILLVLSCGGANCVFADTKKLNEEWRTWPFQDIGVCCKICFGKSIERTWYDVQQQNERKEEEKRPETYLARTAVSYAHIRITMCTCTSHASRSANFILHFTDIIIFIVFIWSFVCHLPTVTRPSRLEMRKHRKRSVIRLTLYELINRHVHLHTHLLMDIFCFSTPRWLW